MIPCYKTVKILLDKCLALVLIVAFFPLMLTLSILVFWDLKRVFFIQQRPGLLGQPFRLYKFQTMREGSQEDTERVTVLGRWLRALSLDELPQLINVLKGEMSFIGPRPLLMEYLVYYSDDHHRRHWVMPGMTGWAQVQGGNTLSWNEKFNLDCEYVDQISFWMDLKIVFKTCLLLLKGEKKHLAVSKFEGY